MITSKENLKQYLEQDRVALHIERKKPRIIGDEIWKFQIALRKYEYYLNVSGGMLHKLKMILAYLRYHRLAVALGLTIPPNVFDRGLSRYCQELCAKLVCRLRLNEVSQQ
ncbi:MAG: hypothetical protein ACLUO8_11165 [Christensenellales bacterium]